MKTRTFFQRRHEKRIDLKAFERSTVSTLLIPKHLIEKLNLVLPVVLDTATIKKSYNFKAGLKKLLDKYRGFLASGFLPFQEKPKLTFRKEGLELQRFSFRPDDADWFEWGILAMAVVIYGAFESLSYHGCLSLSKEILHSTTVDLN